MKRREKKIKLRLMSVILIGIIMFGALITMVSASLNYRSTLVKGTDNFTVSQYDAAIWKTTVNNSTTPSDWIEGETNITGAKSKVTMRGWRDTTWDTYDVLTGIFMPEFFTLEEIFPLLGFMNMFGFNETTINTNYTNNYKLSYGVRSVWNFTSSGYPEEQSYVDGIMVFKNPSDFKAMLDDYYNLSAKLNEVYILPHFPSVSADEFLWQLALNGLAIAKPQTEYLQVLIEDLGCENATSSGNTLIFERYGEANYTVEIKYGGEGTLSSLSVKTADETVIFRIVSTNSEWEFFVIIAVVLICIAGITVVLILRKRKINKLRK